MNILLWVLESEMKSLELFCMLSHFFATTFGHEDDCHAQKWRNNEEEEGLTLEGYEFGINCYLAILSRLVSHLSLSNNQRNKFLCTKKNKAMNIEKNEETIEYV